MGVAYKNFWSLNTDEAVVTGILRDSVKKELEVFMPINAQMKDIDLICVNIENRKLRTIQVKGSKAYEPAKKEIEKFGAGSTGWFFLHKEVIEKSTADYFIFLVYVIEEDKLKTRRNIVPHTITIPTNKLIELTKKHKKAHPDRYSYYFWVNPKEKKAFDFRDELFDVTEYLDKKGFDKINGDLE